MPKKPKISNIVVVAKLNDGTCRQVVISRKTESAVLSVIAACEGKVQICETVLDGVEIDIE